MAEVADNTLVDGRYRVLDRIGSGGMADVYRAEDTHLGRQVALKVLYRRFAQDEQFVERFRREASAAAGLQHPNVVNVYDRGQHEGTYYIAMELLEGKTLKDVIAKEAPLDQLRVVDIGIQVLQAAAFAHRRGVIHRDFKPHNVIVGEEDRLKVTDFGIARAGASEMTETGSIMGTAQYLSPEQAQGHAVTGASDLYSIGVILYEMLVGSLPFEGETAVAIALQHLNDPPAPITSLRPDVSRTLEAAVMRALAKDPAQRYASAEDFVTALEVARTAIRDGTISTEQRTAVFGPAAVGAAAAPDEPMSYAPQAPVAPLEAEDASRERARRRLRILLRVLPVAVLLLIVAFVAFALSRPNKVNVPPVVGQKVFEARAVMERGGFEVDVQRVEDVAMRDTVIEQDPNGGDEADEGSTVTLEVSDGPGERTVPTVDGFTERRAVRALTEAGFKVETTEEASEDVGKGRVTRTQPAGGTTAEIGTRIRVFVSTGPEQVRVPDVVGASRATAESRLDAEGLIAVVEEQASDQAEGTVVSQDPLAPALVPTGSRVTIQVSKGPERESVPEVTGLSVGGARAELQGAGFVPEVRERTVTDELDDEIVVDQRPGAGQELTRGRTVVIYVGKFSPPPPSPTP